MPVTVTEICRYPVKGLSAEPLQRVTLESGAGLPHDRRFAIVHGSMPFDPDKPEDVPHGGLFTLRRDQRLAMLRVVFDEHSGELTILRAGKPVARARATEPVGRTLLDQFFAGFLENAARGAPKLLEARSGTFSDTPRERYISVINLASVRDLERVARRSVAPLRFRGNIFIEGAPAWAEQKWIGKELCIGAARLAVAETIERCAATNVDPETAARDMNIPLLLSRAFGHVCLGVYARVVTGGEIATGDAVRAPP